MLWGVAHCIPPIVTGPFKIINILKIYITNAYAEEPLGFPKVIWKVLVHSTNSNHTICFQPTLRILVSAN